MKYFFNFYLCDRPEDALDDKRHFEVSKKVKTWIEAKAPSFAHQFPAIPYALLAFTYNILPQDVRKFYRKVEIRNPVTKRLQRVYYVLRSIDELGEAAIDKYTLVELPVAF